MKYLIVLSLVALAAADVSHLPNVKNPNAAEILKLNSDANPDGSYQWEFETSDGTSAQAQGQLKNVGSETESQVVQGQAGWISPEGEQVQLSYVADENGYQPQGSHLPTPPPIPAAILRALEYIQAHPPPQESN